MTCMLCDDPATHQWDKNADQCPIYLCTDHAYMIEIHLIAYNSRRPLPIPIVRQPIEEENAE